MYIYYIYRERKRNTVRIKSAMCQRGESVIHLVHKSQVFVVFVLGVILLSLNKGCP